MLSLAPGAEWSAVRAGIDRVLAPFGGLGAVPRAEQGSHWFIANELEQLRSLGRVLPSIFLGVATFLFAVVLARLVMQQRTEIAVLEAFGRTKAEIGLHYAKLVVVVAFLAALAGLLAGRWMGAAMVDIYRPYFRFPRLEHVMSAELVLVAAGVSLGAAFAGAIGAVRRVARMQPAEAMRPPAPPAYRPTLVERVGLAPRLSVPARIVLRNIERKPWRALLSVIGIGSGGGLLLAGLAMADSIDHTIELQFERAQREDVTVLLGAPRASAALASFERLPGVRRAEPFRAVDVRIRAGARARRLALEGLSEGAALRPPIDAEGRVSEVPDHGIALSEGLAEVLGVAPGDEVVVEVLEGRRPLATVVVTGLYSSFVGLSARMDSLELARLLGEGPSLSGAHLLVDPASSAALDEALRETPLVVSATRRADTLARFEETTAESMGFMSFLLVLFATVLVSGVVYNDARVTLAERGRELASMRVLGYRRGEVAAILLGEIWTLAACALPVGAALGTALAYSTLRQAESELFRMPLAIDPSSFAIAALVLAAAAVLSGLACRRGLDRLDLVEVLKERS